jgi:hypothetical protein
MKSDTDTLPIALYSPFQTELWKSERLNSSYLIPKGTTLPSGNECIETFQDRQLFVDESCLHSYRRSRLYVSLYMVPHGIWLFSFLAWAIFRHLIGRRLAREFSEDLVTRTRDNAPIDSAPAKSATVDRPAKYNKAAAIDAILEAKEKIRQAQLD